MAYNYDRERQLKDGQDNKVIGTWPVLIALWGLWAVLMTFVANWFTGAIRAIIGAFTSPQMVNMLHGDLTNNPMSGLLAQLGVKNFLNFDVIGLAPLIWWVIEAVLTIAILPLLIRIRIRWQPRKHNQYGNDRLATGKEIIRQYPQIPDRQYSYPGYGGIPVAHYKPGKQLIKSHPALFWKMSVLPRFKEFGAKIKLLKYNGDLPAPVKGYYSIDQTTVNNLIIGISRSGKGETLVMPFVDILSRAEKKSSMVVNDPKGEIYQMSYNTLRKRGYDVQVLNVQNTDYSMSYNPLQRIVDYAKDGYFDEVQDAVNSLSTSIYVDPNAKDKFWQNSSINLLNSLILAVIDHAKRNDDWEEVTMDNVLHMMTDLGSKQVNVNKAGDIIPDDPEEAGTTVDDPTPVGQKNKLLVYFAKLQKLNEENYSQFRQMALDAFAQSKFAGDETAGNIYSSAMEGIKIYQQSNIAKLTSMNSVNFESLGFPRTIKIKLPVERYKFKTAILEFTSSMKNESVKVLEKRQIGVDKLGIVFCPIKTTLPDDFSVSVSFDFYRNDPTVKKDKIVFEAHKVYKKKGIGRWNYELDPYNGEKILDHVEMRPIKNTLHAKPANEETAAEKKAIGTVSPEVTMMYSERPVALFLVTPPNNPSYNQLPAFAVDQIFNTLWKAGADVGRKTFTRVHFILDEFGNMPTIQDMSQKVSIGLGANLLFSIVVQNLEQLEVHYNKQEATTIQSNCQNLLYILTNSDQTASTISKAIGKRSVVVETISNRVGKVRGSNVSQQVISQDILTSQELMHFMGGEMVVVRSVYRMDQKGNPVSALPIFDHGISSMPYRSTFLSKELDDTTTLADIAIKSLHRSIDLKARRIDYNDAYEQIIQLINDQQPDSPNIPMDPNNLNAVMGATTDQLQTGNVAATAFALDTEDDYADEAEPYNDEDINPIFSPEELVDESDQGVLFRASALTLLSKLLRNIANSAEAQKPLYKDPYLYWHKHNSWDYVEGLLVNSPAMIERLHNAIENRRKKYNDGTLTSQEV